MHREAAERIADRKKRETTLALLRYVERKAHKREYARQYRQRHKARKGS